MWNVKPCWRFDIQDFTEFEQSANKLQIKTQRIVYRVGHAVAVAEATNELHNVLQQKFIESLKYQFAFYSTSIGDRPFGLISWKREKDPYSVTSSQLKDPIDDRWLLLNIELVSCTNWNTTIISEVQTRIMHCQWWVDWSQIQFIMIINSELINK